MLAEGMADGARTELRRALEPGLLASLGSIAVGVQPPHPLLAARSGSGGRGCGGGLVGMLAASTPSTGGSKEFLDPIRWAIILGVVQGLAEFLPIIHRTPQARPLAFRGQRPDARRAVPSTSRFMRVASWPSSRHSGATWPSFFTIRAHAEQRHRSAPRRLQGPAASPASSLASSVLDVCAGGRSSAPRPLDKKLEFLSTPDIAGQARTGIDAATFHDAPLLLGLCMIGFGVVFVGLGPVRCSQGTARDDGRRGRRSSWVPPRRSRSSQACRARGNLL